MLSEWLYFDNQFSFVCKTAGLTGYSWEICYSSADSVIVTVGSALGFCSVNGGDRGNGNFSTLHLHTCIVHVRNTAPTVKSNANGLSNPMTVSLHSSGTALSDS